MLKRKESILKKKQKEATQNTDKIKAVI